VKIKNSMEDFVFSKINGILAEYGDICKCEKCKTDIALLALNHLPPRYVCTDKGDTLTRLNLYQPEKDVDMIREIAKAVEIVSANPHHA